MSRVKSKHLFSSQLDGVWDQDVLQGEADPRRQEELAALFKIARKPNLDPKEFVGVLRSQMEAFGERSAQHPHLIKMMDMCTHSKIEVQTDEGNAVTVLVHTPKSISGAGANPAIVYAHGGGAVSGTAEQYKPYLSAMAVECGVVVFNVDYRLAPETKCPGNILDYYHSLKHVLSHSAALGVDAGRVAAAGESGGGYVVAGAMILMAKKNEADLVKMCILNIPMLDSYNSTDVALMTVEEKGAAQLMNFIWATLAADPAEKTEAFLLHPPKVSDGLLADLPPTVVLEVEFDFYITPAVRFANRLRAAGKLLDLAVLPGCGHGHTLQPQYRCFKGQMEQYKMCVKEYLRGQISHL